MKYLFAIGLLVVTLLVAGVAAAASGWVECVLFSDEYDQLICIERAQRHIEKTDPGYPDPPSFSPLNQAEAVANYDWAKASESISECTSVGVGGPLLPPETIAGCEGLATSTPGATGTITATVTTTATATNTPEASETPTVTVTATLTETVTSTPVVTATITETATSTPVVTVEETPTIAPTAPPTVTATLTGTVEETPTIAPTVPPTVTVEGTPTLAPTAPLTGTVTITNVVGPTPTPNGTHTPGPPPPPPPVQREFIGTPGWLPLVGTCMNGTSEGFQECGQ